MPWVRIFVLVGADDDGGVFVFPDEVCLSLSNDLPKVPGFSVGLLVHVIILAGVRDSADDDGDVIFSKCCPDQIHESFEVGFITSGDLLVASIALTLHPDNSFGVQRVLFSVAIVIIIRESMTQRGEEVIVLIDITVRLITRIEIRFPAAERRGSFRIGSE